MFVAFYLILMTIVLIAVLIGSVTVLIKYSRDSYDRYDSLIALCIGVPLVVSGFYWALVGLAHWFRFLIEAFA